VALGTAIATPLLTRTFGLLGSRHPETFDLCALLAADCDAALGDQRFWLFGVPPAAWTLVYYATLAGLLFLARFLKETFQAEALLAAAVVTLSGVLAGASHALAGALGRVPVCAACLVVLWVNVMLLFAVHKASARSLGEQVRLLRTAGQWVLRSGPAAPQARWKLVGLVSVAFAAIVVYQWLYVETDLRRQRAASASATDRMIAAYRTSPRVAIPVSPDDPHLGSLRAPIQMTVFASFTCSACRRFAPVLQQLRERFGDRLLVAFKHYPLSTECNDRLTVDQQPGSCEVAWAAEAAHRQGAFWSFHDAMFAAAAEGVDESTIVRVVRELDLDGVQFAADRKSASARERVAENAELGTRLRIPGTPAVFLNGRLVRPALEALEILIRQELDLADTASAGAEESPSGSNDASSEARSLVTSAVRSR
jgi:protein-disulfide isomerase